MELEFEEVKKIIEKTGLRTNRFPNARRHELRLRLHSEMTVEKSDTCDELTRFLAWVKLVLPADKAQAWEDMLTFPLKTVPITEKIYNTLARIFDGRNPVFRYDFLSPEDADDFDDYRMQEMKGLDVFEKEGYDRMKTAINSLMVVDLPAEQTGERPEPYFYFLNIDRVVDLKSPDGTEIEWIIYELDDERFAVLDGTRYRVLRMNKKDKRKIEEVEINVEHDLERCPSRFFWSTPLRHDKPWIKANPISSQLGELDLYLLFAVSKENLNLYGRWLIFWAWAQDCDYVNPGNGDHCDGGFLKSGEGEYLRDGFGPVICPVCSTKRFDGAGSYIEIDPPTGDPGEKDMGEPMGVIDIPRTILDYNNEDLKERADEIYRAVTGWNGGAINNEAVNPKQIKAIMETLETALNPVQKNFEKAIAWRDSTIAQLRYGKSFLRAQVSLGTEHYILDSSELLEIYQGAKESKVDSSVLDILHDQYLQTEYRNNAEELNRQIMIVNLDPFRHLDAEEVKAMVSEGMADKVIGLVKLNLSSFILKFERENVPITEFGLGIDFATRVDRIYDVLKQYAEDMMPKEEEAPKPPIVPPGVPPIDPPAPPVEE